MNEEQPKNIQIYLPYGNPQGIRIADLTSRTIQAIQIPRKQLKKSKQRSEVKKVGVYFLFEQVIEEKKPLVYIGEGEKCIHRLEKHNREKDFWNTAIAIVSKTGAFTKTHVKFLEAKSISMANKVDRYQVHNDGGSNPPKTPEPLEAELIDNFRTMKILLATLGYPIFEELRNQSEAHEQIYYCRGKGAAGKGVYVDEGFLVLAGSEVSDKIAPSVEGTKTARLREELVENDILSKTDDNLIFEEDHLFSSPSAASSLILGNSSNGWRTWKTEKGKTLDEVERQ